VANKQMTDRRVGLVLSATDNGGYFFADAPSDVFCPECRSVLDRSYHPKKLTVKKHLDIGVTYDNRKICTPRFKSWLEETFPRQLAFWIVNDDPLMYFFEPLPQLRFDTERRKTEFLSRCHKCSQFREVIGATPAFLKDKGADLSEGIFRTDIEFGSREGKAPLYLVPLTFKEHVQRERFSGLVLADVLE